MFSSAVRTGIRLKNWKMKPSLSRRSLVRSPSSRSVISTPSSTTEPDGRAVEPGEDVHQRRLAGARRAHDRAEAAALEGHAHPGERVDGGGSLAVAAADVGGGDDRIHAAAEWQAAALRAVRITGRCATMEPTTCGARATTRAVADKIAAAGELVVERAGIEPGMDVLDVACGTGNATIPAARAGGARDRPRLLARPARDRARAGRRRDGGGRLDRGRRPGAAVRGRQLRPRDLDASGTCSRPTTRRTADEMRRVCRPDGRIAIACWTPDGNIGGMFQRIAAARPAAARGLPVAAAVGHRGPRARAARRRRRVRAPRGRVARRLRRGLRRVHGEQLRTADRTPGSGSATRSCTRPTSASSTRSTRPTTGRFASAASTCSSVVARPRARPARARRSPRARGPRRAPRR